MAGLGEWLPLGLDRVGRRATGPGQLGPGLPGPERGAGVRAATEGGSAQQRAERWRQRAGAARALAGRAAPTEPEPYRQRATRTDRAGGREDRMGQGSSAPRCRPAPGPRRKRAGPSGRLPQDVAQAASCGAVSPCCVVRAYMDSSRGVSISEAGSSDEGGEAGQGSDPSGGVVLEAGGQQGR